MEEQRNVDCLECGRGMHTHVFENCPHCDVVLPALLQPKPKPIKTEPVKTVSTETDQENKD